MVRRTPNVVRVLLACLLGLSFHSLAAVTSAQAQPVRSKTFLECANIRRLSDNYLLDLRVRLTFQRNSHTYARFENEGRGWQFVGLRRYTGRTPTRILLEDTPISMTYIERLTGDYYYVDRTGFGLSLWGRCVRTGGLAPNF